jgi:sulfate adenylyltransferase
LPKIREIDLIKNDKKYLIDQANIDQKLILNQKNFLNQKQFQRFLKKPVLGLPLVLPYGLNCYDYKNVKEVFKIKKKDIYRKIFKTKVNFYHPAETFFKYGNTFCVGAKPKKKYKKIVRSIIKINSDLEKKIKSFKNNNKIIGAIQTRNIPHLGHELIIKKLLKECDIVFINPIIGPKKKGDVKPSILTKVYKFLIKNYYDKRVVYAPVIANMFYAGPREALHHSLIRQQLGFSKFIVGRDHAGSNNIYKPLDAINLINLYKSDLKIKVIRHQGSYYCIKCKKIIIQGECKHRKKNLKSISGTEFRYSLKRKIPFKFARQELQEYIYSLRENLFY